VFERGIVTKYFNGTTILQFCRNNTDTINLYHCSSGRQIGAQQTRLSLNKQTNLWFGFRPS